ncbi:MAG TPA: LPS export ABC transporter periplasmic protein LptC [Luteitalea sp.]|nr:LPS export ABC transporter periplasmic protein LptC [Luteitalea sp.]
MRWRGLLRYGFAAFALGFAVWLGLQFRGRRIGPGGASDPRTDPNAIVESSGGLITRTRAEQKDLDLQHKGLKTYPDGRTVFQSVTVTVPARDDRRGFTVKGDEAEVTKDNAQVLLKGNLQLTTTDGLTMTGPEATYDSADGIIRIPGEVKFKRELMTGSSIGATYDNTRDVLWMLERARIDVARDARGQGETHMTAGSAGFARADRYIRLQDAASVQREGQTLGGDTATVFMQPTADIVELIELRGNSTVTLPAPQSLQSMSATDINLAYQADGRTLRQVTLAERANVQFRAQGKASQGRRLAGAIIDMQLDADGTTMTGLTAQEAVELTVPQDGATPARVIKGDTLTGAGQPGRGLTGTTFTNNVSFRETRTAARGQAALDRTITSQTLELQTSGAIDAIDRATFNGTVAVKDAEKSATAPRLVYRTESGDITLSAEGTPLMARIDDKRGSVQSRIINIIGGGDDLVAETDVRSVLQGGGDGPARPGMFREDQPVNVTAAKLERRTGKAVYTGDAQIWQGATSIKGESITLDEESGNLLSVGKVRTVMELEEKDAATGKTERNVTTGTANELEYQDKERKAILRESARLVSARDGDLRGARIEMFLREGGRELERLEAYDGVTLQTSTRNATGARLTYFTADGRYVMSGAPVVVLEQFPTECRETTGRRLTFFRTSDVITVDGNQSTRTQGRTAGTCPALKTPA